MIEHAAHLLPAQGPIGIFVHHNTLHAFERLPFETAVVQAARLFGAEPFLAEQTYRELLREGRIRLEDLDAMLRPELGEAADVRVAGRVTRLAWRRHAMLSLVEESNPAVLRWRLVEGVLDPAATANAPRQRPAAVEALWRASEQLVRTARRPSGGRAKSGQHRLRDALVPAGAADPDELVHPLLIRLVAAFVDQGISYWTLPDREEGLWVAACRLLGQPRGNLEPWLRDLGSDCARLARDGVTAADAVLERLDELGVDQDHWDEVLSETLLALPGWGGIVRQLEVRPDRAPVHAPPARLVDFLALRLVLERHACAWVAEQASIELSRIRWGEPTSEPAASDLEVAASVFQVAAEAGLSAAELSALGAEPAEALVGDLRQFHGWERRRLWHLAYERRHRVEVLDALGAHAARAEPAPPAEPRFQMVFCIDERAESIRRHLEELGPEFETFGTAGFFGVAMYYRGIDDAHASPLCPIGIRPAHEVHEVAAPGHSVFLRRRRAQRRFAGRWARGAQIGSRTALRGTLWSAAAGLWSAIPLVARVLLPRTSARLRGMVAEISLPDVDTELTLERFGDDRLPNGRWLGFSVEEMAKIVGDLLEEIGLTDRFVKLVTIVGHGSASLNNPHESAHDCGACGGGRGGPNARAFAMMANHAGVREHLRTRGIEIPDSTHFLGAYFDTCNDGVTLFDAEDVPQHSRGQLEAVQLALQTVRRLDAQERCRRFENAPLEITPEAALRHVEGRAEDLAQPRPEYGHATNAICIVGRRSRTRGLYLDRRAFLASYDPTRDPEGEILLRILSSVGPVGAGINLEYWFSYVDPARYGCGTKLPHNITGLVGVMDGHASDLRTGLPWQMVEIHEPVRLLCVVESPPELLTKVVARHSAFEQMVRNRWVQVVALDPGGPALWLLRDGGFEPYTPSVSDLPTAGTSREYYAGRRQHLPIARIDAGLPGLAWEACL